MAVFGCERRLKASKLTVKDEGQLTNNLENVPGLSLLRGATQMSESHG